MSLGSNNIMCSEPNSRITRRMCPTGSSRTFAKPSRYMRADLSTQKRSNVLILNIASSGDSAEAAASLVTTAFDLVAVAAVACFAAGLKDIH